VHDPITDPVQAGERLLASAREGRLVQGVWHDKRDGREIACLLGAAAGISDPAACPARLMPPWVAIALPSLFDGQSESHAIPFAIRWGEAMIRPEWTNIAWDAVRTQWLAFVVQQARAANADAFIYANAFIYADAAARAAARAADYTAAAASFAAYAARADAAAAAAYAADAARAAAARAAAYAAYAAAYAAARNDQGDALMNAIEKSMEVARG
jgi:hypothetical protein